MNKEKYEYKGNTYYIEAFSAFKHPETRLWVDCVIYYAGDTGVRWVREKEEFFERFNKVEQNGI